MSARNVGAGALLRMSGGALVWTSAFVALYTGYSLGCQNVRIVGDPGLANPVTLALVAIALLHVAAMAWLGVRWFRRPVAAQPGESKASRGFRHRVERMVLGVSGAALLFVAFPILMVPPCVG